MEAISFLRVFVFRAFEFVCVVPQCESRRDTLAENSENYVSIFYKTP